MERLKVRREMMGLLLAAAAAAAVAALALSALAEERLVVAAVEAREVSRLCAASGYSLRDFWERAEAAGVGAVVLRERPLSELIERGEVFSFRRDEIEKWKAVGLVAPGLSIKPDTLWTRDARLLSAILDSAWRRGLAVSTTSFSGHHVAEFRGGLEEGLAAGYDPELLRSLEEFSLAHVRAPFQPGEAYRTAEGLELKPSFVAAQAGPGAWLKAAYGHPRRLLVIQLDEGAGVDANIEDLRECLRRLEGDGVSFSDPPRATAEEAQAPWKARLSLALFWALGLLGPLFAARVGLLALKRTRTAALAHWPLASPVLQIAAGLAGAAAAAAGMGLAARAVGDPSAGLGPWRFWTMAGPILLGALTLYEIDLAYWRERLLSPATYAELLGGLAALAAAALFLSPRAALTACGLWPWAEAAYGALPEALWWASWRWREMLIGFPCLVQAFFLINWRMDCPDCESLESAPLSDPRCWFLPALLGPAGIVAALGGGGLTSAGAALAHTAAALGIASLLGALAVAVRLRLGSPHEPR